MGGLGCVEIPRNSVSTQTDSEPVIPEHSVEDLRSRWTRARENAAHQVLGRWLSEEALFANLERVSEEEFSELLKMIFLNSRNLGRGYQRTFNIAWDRSDFGRYLRRMESPCLMGEWIERKNAFVLARPGCASGRRFGRRYCQYWREAADGLIMGLSDTDRFVRHGSVAADDGECVDVIFQDEETPTDSLWNNLYRWGPLPEAYRLRLEEIEVRARGLKIDLRFLGVSEGQLYYKLEPKENLTCGSAGSIYRSWLESAVRAEFPALILRDASPVAVYGEKS